jgi:hypothetical protein
VQSESMVNVVRLLDRVIYLYTKCCGNVVRLILSPEVPSKPTFCQGFEPHLTLRVGIEDGETGVSPIPPSLAYHTQENHTIEEATQPQVRGKTQGSCS